MRAIRFWAIVLSPCILGCSSDPIVVDKPLDATVANLLKISAAYNYFCFKNRRPPSGPSDIRAALAEGGDADQILQSTRDGQPLVICWGVDVSKRPDWAKSTPVLAYEKQGVDGSRYVLTVVRSVALISDKDFREASFPPGHNPGEN